MITLDALEAFANGKPYSETRFLKTLRSLCDTVIKTHYRRYDPDEEVFSVAIYKVTKLLCEGKVDFSQGRAKVFSFIYTVVRNEIGNYLKSRFTYYTNLKTAKERAAVREQDPATRSHAAPWTLGNPSGYEDKATINATIIQTVKDITTRFRGLGLTEPTILDRYAGLCLRAACFRAAYGTG